MTKTQTSPNPNGWQRSRGVVLLVLLLFAALAGCGPDDGPVEPGETAAEPSKTAVQPSKTAVQPSKTAAEFAEDACDEIRATDEDGYWTVSTEALDLAASAARGDSAWLDLYRGSWWLVQYTDAAAGTADEYGRWVKAADMVADSCDMARMANLDYTFRTGPGYNEGPVGVPGP